MFKSLLKSIRSRSPKHEARQETHKLEAPKSNFASLKSSFDETNKDVEATVTSIASRTSDVNETRDETQHVWTASRQEKLIMVTCAVASLIVALDATILVPVLPTLAVDLHGTAADAFWTGTSYLLTHAVLQPFIATLSDIFGRRELLVPSIAFFAVGSVVCALAHNFTTMLIGRVLQGVGGAGIITLTQVIFADLIPLRQRPRYMAMVLGAWALGSVVGPLVGGVFVEKATWRWCFWLNLPICGVALPMAIFFVNLTQPATDLATKLKKVDWIGNFLFISSLTSFLIAISWAGIQFEWSSFRTLVPMCLGVIGLLAAILYEAKFARHPFLTHSIFNGMSANASYVAALLQGLLVYMALYYQSFYFTACHFFGPIRTGLSIFPSTTLLLPGSAIVSSLITRFGKFRWAIWAGYAISTVGTGLMIMWDDKTSTPVWAVCECLFGLGIGMVLASVNSSIQANVAPENSGQAAAMYAFIRSIGMALGVAIGGTVFQNTMKGKLQDLEVKDAAEIARQAEGFVQQLKALSTVGAEGVARRAIMSGYVHGFRGVWIVMTVLSAAGLLVSLLIKRGNLDVALTSKFHVEERQTESK